MSNPLVHLVDDDDAIRDALAWLFRSRGVDTAGWPGAEPFLAEWSPALRGCLVLDIRMQGMSGLECFDTLIARGNSMPVIFLTGHGDVPMAVGALKRGAYHFIEKPFNDNELVDVVIGALDMDARNRATQDSLASVQARLETLTTRERQVMEQILAGRLNKVIADELAISMRTVEVHRARIFDKMRVRSAVELATLLANLPSSQA